MKPLSDRQRALLASADSFISEHGYPPSVRELGEAVGLHSSCTVQRHLEALESRGYIRRAGRKSRTLELTSKGKAELIPQAPSEAAAPLQVPLVGTIAAGQPILAEEHIEDFLSVDASLLGKGTHFALKVQGESMINAGILDGDTVVVRKQASAENGDIVAALLDDSATVKRLYKHNSHLELRPENPTMEPIITRDAKVLGKVVLVMRRLD